MPFVYSPPPLRREFKWHPRLPTPPHRALTCCAPHDTCTPASIHSSGFCAMWVRISPSSSSAKHEPKPNKIHKAYAQPRRGVTSREINHHSSAQSQMGVGPTFLDEREWLALYRVSSPLKLTSFRKKLAYFFLHGAGKYGDRNFHAPARYAGWLQDLYIYSGWVSVPLLGKIGKIPPKYHLWRSFTAGVPAEIFLALRTASH